MASMIPTPRGRAWTLGTVAAALLWPAALLNAVEPGDPQDGVAALFRAVRDHDAQSVAALIAGGAAIDAKTPQGETALMAALQGDPRTLSFREDRDIVLALIGQGAEVNATGMDGDSVLGSALERGQSDLVSALLAAGADPNLGRRPPLLLAVQRGDLDMVEALIDQGATLTPAALAWAVSTGQVDLVKRLVERGANVNAGIEPGGTLGMPGLRVRDRCGNEIALNDKVRRTGETRTVSRISDADGGWMLERCDNAVRMDGAPGVLSIAAVQGNREMLQVLLDLGARVAAQDASGRTALSYALAFDQAEAAELLLGRGAKVAPTDTGLALEVAARAGRTGLLQTLIGQGADIAGQGAGALFEAAQRGAVATVRLLLDLGLDPQARPDFNASALCFAVANGQTEVVRLLLARGADVNCRMNGLDTRPAGGLPWQRVTPELAPLLIDHGADLKVRDKDGRTVLMDAVAGKSPAVVRLLLEHGVAVDAKDTGGRTALLHALNPAYYDGNREADQGARKQAQELALVLIGHGADVNVRQSDGWTPLMIAVFGRDEVLVRALLARGAAVDAKGVDGRTSALSLAGGGDDGIAGLLKQAGATPEPRHQ